MIPVTRPFLPPWEVYESYLKGIWERNWLTNNGPLVNELEHKLKNYLNVGHLLFTGNGTIAIQIAIKALGLKGKIITTPFSYVATSSSIVWEGCEPVFVDIDPHTLNIDPKKIEQAITGETSAILATHVYGNACDVDAIATIAKKHNLKTIYDGAHAFGTRYKGRSIFEYGDVTTASFHATKLFHTVEGGAVATGNPELSRTMAFMRNFGHNGPHKFAMVGINGKNSEFHAAMGLTNLNYMDEILEKRKSQSRYYDEVLQKADVEKPRIEEHCDFNFAYYAVLFHSEHALLEALAQLEQHDIQPRRYFYPVLSTLPYAHGEVPVAESVSRRVLCLPLYHSLSMQEQDLVAKCLLTRQRK